MMTEDFIDDIPREMALNAHLGTSFVPEKRAQGERDSYAAEMVGIYDDLQKLADTDEKRGLLESEFARFRAGYKNKIHAWLSARGRIVSTMIAGPSNFPVRQMEKRGDTAHRRLTELLEFKKRAMKAIRRKLCPEAGPIMSGDDDAVSRLEKKIAQAEAKQEQMKAVNATIRKNWKHGVKATIAALVEIGVPESLAMQLTDSSRGQGTGYQGYSLKNNNANIRRMKQRLAKISKAQATPATEQTTEGGITIEDCPADNRVRLFFPGKPDSEVRSRLKSNGFRWAPSLGCWQAYRNNRSLSVAESFA